MLPFRIAAAIGLAVGVSAVSAHAARPNPRGFLVVDASRHSVQLTLLAGLDGSNGGFNFDGYGRGEMLVSIPAGWRLVVVCESHGSGRFSCAVVRNSLSTRPAFPGAASPNPTVGLNSGAKTTFSFVPEKVGSYRIASLVPGQEQARMWDVLDVTRGGRPSISARPGP
jgi:Sulfocyanin (SoxE) domain